MIGLSRDYGNGSVVYIRLRFVRRALREAAPRVHEGGRQGRQPVCGEPGAGSMSDGFQYFDIILFAMIAAFLVLRLRSVLGRRTGDEHQRDLFRRPLVKPEPHPASDNHPAPDNVVALPERATAAEAASRGQRPGSVASGIAQIRSADPAFEPRAFIEGAHGAFELIVGAFARGDSAALRPLLSDDVFERFADAIRQRTAAKETLETRLLAIKSSEIEEAELQGRTAFVTVRFVSNQVNVLHGPDGAVLEGHPNEPVEKTDFWTFARNTRSQDPNWLLVATRSP